MAAVESVPHGDERKRTSNGTNDTTCLRRYEETTRLWLESGRTILDALSRFSRHASISAPFDSNKEARPALREVTEWPYNLYKHWEVLGRGLPRVRSEHGRRGNPEWEGYRHISRRGMHEQNNTGEVNQKSNSTTTGQQNEHIDENAGRRQGAVIGTPY